MSFTYGTITPLYDSNGDVIAGNLSTFTHLTQNIILELRENIDALGADTKIIGNNWDANHYFQWTKGTTIALDGDRHWLSYITDLRTACEELCANLIITAPDWTINTSLLTPLYDVDGVVISNNISSYTDARLKSLYEDIRTETNRIADNITCFVDASGGNDTTGDGSFDNPYQTFDKMSDVIYADSAFFFKRVYLITGSYTISAGKGIRVTDRNVTFTSNPFSKANISLNQGGGNLLPCYTTGVSLENLIFNCNYGLNNIADTSSYIAFENCVFQGSSASGAGLYTSNHFTFTSCSFNTSSYQLCNIYFTGGNTYQFTSCSFGNCVTCLFDGADPSSVTVTSATWNAPYTNKASFSFTEN